MSELFPDEHMRDVHDSGQGPSGKLAEHTDDEIGELAVLVAKALVGGESRDKVIGDLTNNGWPQDEADNFVSSIEYELAQAQAQHSGGGEGMGWLIWIGALILINVLSAVFDWGFWIY